MCYTERKGIINGVNYCMVSTITLRVKDSVYKYTITAIRKISKTKEIK
jgi:hypothetical protein